jgi:hypothetical protein
VLQDVRLSSMIGQLPCKVFWKLEKFHLLTEQPDYKCNLSNQESSCQDNIHQDNIQGGHLSFMDNKFTPRVGRSFDICILLLLFMTPVKLGVRFCPSLGCLMEVLLYSFGCLGLDQGLCGFTNICELSLNKVFYTISSSTDLII